MTSFNLASNSTFPPWLPQGFQTRRTNGNCASGDHVLVSFAIYNCVAIASFLLIGHSHLLTLLFPWKKHQPPAAWSFWSAVSSLAFQILGNVVTSLLIRRGGYDVDIWQLMQLWALRPRVAWLLGNTARIGRKWGYQNGALTQIFVEVFVCGLATVFLGRTLQAAWRHEEYSVSPWWKMMVAASTIMLVSTGAEILWALWMVKRVIQQGGNAEAQDVDSLKWIAAFFVPVTAICSWLVWVAFLKASNGAYCMKNGKWVSLVWGLIPIFTNVVRLLIEAYSLPGNLLERRARELLATNSVLSVTPLLEGKLTMTVETKFSDFLALMVAMELVDEALKCERTNQPLSERAIKMKPLLPPGIGKVVYKFPSGAFRVMLKL